jgi:hypothetical protein
VNDPKKWQKKRRRFQASIPFDPRDRSDEQQRALSKLRKAEKAEEQREVLRKKERG